MGYSLPRGDTETQQYMEPPRAETETKAPKERSDEAAKVLLMNFAKEVGKWRMLKVKRPHPEGFATYLTDKYMYKQLDNMADSKLVQVAKQGITMEIAKILEIQRTSTQGRSESRRSEMMKERRDWKAKQLVENGRAIVNTKGRVGGGMLPVELKELFDRAEKQESSLRSLRE